MLLSAEHKAAVAIINSPKYKPKLARTASISSCSSTCRAVSGSQLVALMPASCMATARPKVLAMVGKPRMKFRDPCSCFLQGNKGTACLSSGAVAVAVCTVSTPKALT